MTANAKLFFAWLLPSTVACLIALGWSHGSYVDGEYLPMGHDTFYHAHRILTAIPDLSNYYEFDPNIHAPEGSWITWPWFYDWFLALVTVVVQAVAGIEKPMAVLVHIPVLWVYINSALLLAIGGALGLSLFARAILLTAYALSPLTLGLHGFGLFDHHFMEQTCIFAVLLGGLLWFRDADNWKYAVGFGVSLGLSHGIHNGLFMLLLPVMATFLLQWVLNSLPSRASCRYFVIAYLLSLLLVLLPSEPFRHGFFQYYTLSWFHLYVCIATCSILFYMVRMPLTRRNVFILLALMIMFAAPVLSQFIVGLVVMTGDLHSLDTMADSLSLWEMLVDKNWSAYRLTQFYSLFLWLLPVTLWLVGKRLIHARTNNAVENYFFIFSLFALLLLAQQFRFHHYGSFMLYLPLIYVLDKEGFAKLQLSYKRALSGFFVFLAFVPGFSLLAAKPAMALDNDHHLLRPLYLELAKICAANPGVVMANMNDGHYISYYTKCAVISDNFILTEQHIKKIQLTEHLMTTPVEQAVGEVPWVDYYFLRLFKSDIDKNGFDAHDIRKRLLVDQLDSPDALQLLVEANLRIKINGEPTALGRIFRVKK